MIKNWRIALALVLTLVGLLLAGVLWLEHHGEGAVASVVQPICGVDAQGGCEAVKRSAYSAIAGWPLAAFGAAFYGALLFLLLLSWLADDELRQAGLALALLLAAWGVVVDLALLGVQAIALHTFCKLCLLSYVGSLGPLLLLLPARQGLAMLWRAPRQAGARALLLAWLALALVFAGGVATGELLLDTREVLTEPARAEQYFLRKSVEKFEQTPARALDLATAPTTGGARAPIHVVVFSDFLCPWCRQFAAYLDQYLPQVQSQVSLSFKNYPLDTTCNPALSVTMHEGACILARGGICAAQQSRFWPYHTAMFQAELAKATRDDAIRIARSLKLDVTAFDECLDSTATAERLAHEIAEARAAGVRGTPTVFINGRELQRAGDLPVMVQVEAARLGLAGRPNPGGR